MLSPAVLPVLAFLLCAGCVGGILLALFYSRIVGGSPLDRRIEEISNAFAVPAGAGDPLSEKTRKRSVKATLQEADDAQKAKAKKRYKPSLSIRLRQANVDWTLLRYYLTCAGCGGALFLMVLSLGLMPAIGFGIAGGLLLPHLYVGIKRRRRFEQFRTLFPDAIDVVVRGIKSGIPLIDCFRIVASEANEPVRAEFRTIIADQTLGLPLGDAVQRLPDRIPVPEASFFAIVIAVQSRTGGNLSEALGNLSTVLRLRKKMLSKISAMSAEAKSGGVIIASLPIAVGVILYFTSPAYIGLLFTTFTGNMVLTVCALWMGVGVLVMRQMINFDF